MKKEKFKNILLIISLALNILFTLFLTLSLVSVKNSKAQSVSAENKNVNTLNNTQWVLNSDISYTPTNGELFNGSSYERYSLKIYIPERESVYYHDYDFIDFDYKSIYFITSSGASIEVYNYTRSPRWLTSFRHIVILGGEDVENELLINWFINNGSSNSGDKFNFTYLKNFNYNAPWFTSGDSMFISGATIGNNIVEYYFNTLFLSNNQLFDTIRLVYVSGNGSAYYDSPNSTLVHINDNSNLFYYNYMEFGNTYTDEYVVVNNRNYRSYYNSSSSSTNIALDYGSTWTNSNYQTLIFLQGDTPENITKLNQFNNYDVYSGVVPTDTTDVGLGQAFTLIGSAFGALTSIFAIQLLPGITIGLLLFMPLIVGIILFIIWLIKR